MTFLATVTDMSVEYKPVVITVVGPTAAGKTGLAIDLAKQFGGEVISADSRQVYRGLDIGTAKVTLEEAQGIPHHLIDMVDVDTVYTAKDFLRDADAAVADITERGKLPIVAGGTFFYVELLRRRMQPAPVPPDYTLRQELEKKTTNELFTTLQTKDPERAATIDPYNRRRLVRALEIVESLGAVPPISTNPPCPYDILTLGITRPKEELRGRFAVRATTWLAQGLLDEVRGLLNQGISTARLQEFGFEYTLANELLEKSIDEGTFIEKFVQKNWQYAKRQLTWLKRDPSIIWIEPNHGEEAIQHVTLFLKTT